MSEPKRRGRPRLQPGAESIPVHFRLPEPDYDRLYAVREGDEDMADVIRRAIQLLLSVSENRQPPEIPAS